jgi:hypothetical protein
MYSFMNMLGALIGLAIYCLVLFLVVRAAVTSALERQNFGLGATNQLLGAQADLTARLAKHPIAQTELMLLQARHDGMTDEQLEPVLKQVAERKADPALNLPFS